MTTHFVSIPASATVGDALATLRSLEEVPDPLLAVYAVDPDKPGVLQGIVRLRNLILADPSTPLAAVMDEDVPTVGPNDRAEDAARILAEYNLLAVPVLDDETRKLLGVVTVDDALAVLLPDVWQRRSPRSFAA